MIKLIKVVKLRGISFNCLLNALWNIFSQFSFMDSKKETNHILSY